MAEYAPFRTVLIPAGSTSGTSQGFNCHGYTYLTGYVITSDDTVSAGGVTFEEASYDPEAFGAGGYAGTWDAIGSAVTPVQANVVATHLTVGAYDYVRARVSTAVTGGATITVVLVGQRA